MSCEVCGSEDHEDYACEPDGYYCGSCGEDCLPMIVDMGIGYYEYWGFPGVDRRPCLVSHCCEEDVYENRALVRDALSELDLP